MIKVGSDFSGVGAFDQALRRLNIEYQTMFSCDMDKYARQTYIENYGEPKYYPENVYNRDIPKDSLDIYMTSPPCQSFSLAGKRKGEDSVNGVLFYNSHEFIMKNNPRYFIFENVKGLLSDAKGRTFQTWLDMLGGKSVNGNPVIFPREDSTPYHVYHQVLNSKNYGVPQNRERIFIIGIRDDKDNNFQFPKPFHLTKRLKDVLEDEVDEKYFLSDDNIDNLLIYNKRQTEKGTGFSAKFRDIEVVKTMDALKCGGGGKDDLIKVNSATNIGKGVAQTLDTQCNQGVMIGAIRGRNTQNKENKQMLELNKNGTSNSLTTVQKDNVVFIADYRADEGLRIRKDNVSPCMTSSMRGGEWKANRGTRNPPIVGLKSKIRRLTPRECFRLMDFTDSFKMPCSNSQMYKQAGNSIVVNVLAEIINKLNL